ncbi:MAG: carboxypeptidase-like regulatory domain-containing protein, partial [Sphingomonadales bacterium]
MRISFLFLLFTAFCLQPVFAQRADGSIKGKLIDSTAKQPVTDATVSVISARDSSLASFTLSTKLGTFEIKNLLPGDYKLVVSSKGLQEVRRSFSITSENKSIDLGSLT